MVLSLSPFPVEVAWMAVLVVEVLFLRDILRYATGAVMAPLNTIATNPPGITFVTTRPYKAGPVLAMPQGFEISRPFERPKGIREPGLSTAVRCGFWRAAD